MQMSRSESAAVLRKPRLQGGRLLMMPPPQPAAPFSARTVTSGLVTQLSLRLITTASLKESLGPFALQMPPATDQKTRYCFPCREHLSTPRSPSRHGRWRGESGGRPARPGPESGGRRGPRGERGGKRGNAGKREKPQGKEGNVRGKEEKRGKLKGKWGRPRGK